MVDGFVVGEEEESDGAGGKRKRKKKLKRLRRGRDELALVRGHVWSIYTRILPLMSLYPRS